MSDTVQYSDTVIPACTSFLTSKLIVKQLLQANSLGRQAGSGHQPLTKKKTIQNARANDASAPSATMTPIRRIPRSSTSSVAPVRAVPTTVLLVVVVLALVAGRTDAQACSVLVVNNYAFPLDLVYTFDGGDVVCLVPFDSFSVADRACTFSLRWVGPHSRSVGIHLTNVTRLFSRFLVLS
jgi:hypothetical protein